MPEDEPLLRLVHVAKTYPGPGGDGGGVEVLRDVNLELSEGDAVAVVGPSGSGKSTLLNIIGALDRPTAGEVYLAGRELSKLGDQELARIRNREIGFVFQTHHLLPQCTVLENVLVPTLVQRDRDDTAEQRARDLLQRVGLAPRIHHRPGQLSGGECQRVAVVRALINQPRLLLADEPTGSLDRKSSQDLAQLLVDLNREMSVTLILVTHAMELAARMQRQFQIREGSLVLTGEPS